MRAGEAVGDNRGIGFASPGSVGGPLVRLLVRLFGCCHAEMGRPFTTGGETYRVCLHCGARRRFDTDSWSMKGPYYF